MPDQFKQLDRPIEDDDVAVHLEDRNGSQVSGFAAVLFADHAAKCFEFVHTANSAAAKNRSCVMGMDARVHDTHSIAEPPAGEQGFLETWAIDRDMINEVAPVRLERTTCGLEI